MIGIRGVFAAIIVLLGGFANAAPADGCDSFGSNMHRELALFATRPAPIGAAPVAQDAPTLQVDRLYLVTLAPQASVRFAHEPSRQHPQSESSYAGILRFSAPLGASYRISLDQAAWVDVVRGTALISPSRFQGSHDCILLHKSVQFELPAREGLLIQLAESKSTTVKLAITAVTH